MFKTPSAARFACFARRRRGLSVTSSGLVFCILTVLTVGNSQQTKDWAARSTSRQALPPPFLVRQIWGSAMTFAGGRRELTAANIEQATVILTSVPVPLPPLLPLLASCSDLPTFPRPAFLSLQPSLQVHPVDLRLSSRDPLVRCCVLRLWKRPTGIPMNRNRRVNGRGRTILSKDPTSPHPLPCSCPCRCCCGCPQTSTEAQRRPQV